MSFFDILSAVFLLSIAVAFAYGSNKLRSLFSQTVEEAKGTLKSKGVNYDPRKGGLDIKTDRRAPDREDYVTQTSQAMLNSSKRLAKSGAASFGTSSVQTSEDRKHK